ncbi:MAG TPA: hypothetical protein VIH10_14935 [Kribbella sp.]|jgi:hypothetical protein
MASTDPDREPESDSEPDPSEDSGHEPDPEQAKRTSTRFLWSCAWLTVMVGFFLLSDVLRGDGGYGALAWLGVVVAILCLLALIAVYVACARDRITLRTNVVGRVDVFQVATVVTVVAVVAGVLVQTRNTTSLALLLPWGLTYWLYNLDRRKTPTT